MTALAARLSREFSRDEQLFSPSLEDSALRIAADQLWLERGQLSFRLLVSWSLPLDLAASFHALERGMVAVLRSATAATTLRLWDPSISPFGDPPANFERRARIETRAQRSGFIAVPVRAQVGSETSLLAHVVLLHLQSNVIRVGDAA